MANLSLLGLWLHWTASVEHRQYCRLIIWIYLVAALVPVSEEVCRSVDVYQRGKLLTLELKTGTLLKFGVRFKVTLVVVNLLWNIGNVIWVEAYHYFQVILLIIGGNFINCLRFAVFMNWKKFSRKLPNIVLWIHFRWPKKIFKISLMKQ